MTTSRYAPIAVLSLLAAAPALAQETGASWLRSRSLQNALNPKISAIADAVATAGPRRADSGLDLREVELTFQSEVDPYARMDLFIAKPKGEEVEIEEGYITLHSLPGRLQARGGRFRPSFGRLNMVHQHERPQVDSPLALEAFLGPEGLRDDGVEVSRVFAPFGLYTELSYAFLNALGEASEEEGATTTVTDVNGNDVEVAIAGEGEKHSGKFRDYAHVARARAYKDLTDTANADLGLSGAIHQPKGRLHRSLLGADLTLRWRPLKEGQYRSFIWRTEYLLSRRRLPDEFDLGGGQVETAAKVDRRGAYSYLEWQWARRWRGGLRGDYAEDPGLRDPRSVTRAVTPYLAFTPTEFHRLRLQWQRRWLPARGHEDRLQLQWTVVLGPHGAHPF